MGLHIIGCNYAYGFYSLELFCSIQKQLHRKEIHLYGKAPQVWIDAEGFLHLQNVIDTVHRYGLHIHSFEAAEYGYHFGYTNADMRNCSKRYFQNVVDFCAGASISNLYLYIKPNGFHEAEMEKPLLFETFLWISEYAREKGIEICYKCTDRSILFMQELEKLLRQNQFNFSYGLDTLQQPESLSNIISQLGTPDTVFLHGTAQAIEGYLFELTSRCYAGSVVAYKTYMEPCSFEDPDYLNHILQSEVSVQRMAACAKEGSHEL